MAKGQGPARNRGPGGERPHRTPLQGLVYWGAVLSVWGLIFLATVFFVFAMDLPDTSQLYDVTRQPSITYTDRSGSVLAVRGSQYAPPVDLDKLPKYVPDAFVAIEDQHFYSHPGFNPWGIIRSQIYNMRHPGGPLRGGSTITQQLARNLFLSADQNMRRKIQELILAVWLEIKFSKKEILALYLNRVYFGGGAYGIEAASQRYFNKPASEISLGEAAILAGLIKGPSRYSPLAKTDRSARRADVVLDAMVRDGKITEAERAAAIAAPVRVSQTLANQNAQYFVDWVDAQVRGLVGDRTEDLVVETTIHLPLQMAAEAAVRRIVARDGKSRGVEQASLVALDGDGRVRAYIGGVSYIDSQFDRAANAQRQAGSAFKPFVYLTAVEQGRTPDMMVVDEPLKIGDWEPRNYDGRFLGSMTLQTALAKSINTVAARLASEVGTANVAATARRLGITGHIQTDPSMALGAVEVTPVQMAQAYAPFANGGYSARAYGIERIRTTDGQVLYDASLSNPGRAQVIGTPALQYMNQMLRQVPISGTGGRARVAGIDMAGKTGTTSNYKDAWFIGYTGGFVAAVWVGKDSNKAMKGVSGGQSPAEIWKLFMEGALPYLRVTEIPGGAPPPPAGAPDSIDDLLMEPDPYGAPDAPLAPSPPQAPAANLAPGQTMLY